MPNYAAIANRIMSRTSLGTYRAVLMIDGVEHSITVMQAPDPMVEDMAGNRVRLEAQPIWHVDAHFEAEPEKLRDTLSIAGAPAREITVAYWSPKVRRWVIETN